MEEEMQVVAVYWTRIPSGEYLVYARDKQVGVFPDEKSAEAEVHRQASALLRRLEQSQNPSR